METGLMRFLPPSCCAPQPASQPALPVAPRLALPARRRPYGKRIGDEAASAGDAALPGVGMPLRDQLVSTSDLQRRHLGTVVAQAA